MDGNYRDHIVEFEKYCKNCEYRFNPEDSIPCTNCLYNTTNTDSRKPTEFKPSEEYLKKEKIRKERERLQSRSRLKR